MSEIFDTSHETLKLLNHIIHHDSICIKHLSTILKNNKSERSNLRHFKTIQSFFQRELNIEIFERTSRGCYQVINKKFLEQALNLGDRKELLSYIHILKEILPHYYETLDSTIQNRIKCAEKDTNFIYIFHNNPMEDFKKSNILILIEKAIKLKRKSTLLYKEQIYKDIKPLSIIFMEGNMYLACLTNDDANNGFKFLRINQIENFEIGVSEFHKSEKVVQAYQFLQEFQTPFASFDSKYHKVLIDARQEVAQYFLQKKHLPSQEEKMFKDGSIQLTYYVTNYKEVAPLVKKWMPYLTIKEPIDWRHKLMGEVEEYLDVLHENDK